MTIRLKISAARLTVGDVIRAEEGFKSNRETVEFLARFIVDENDKPMDRDTALALIMELPIGELNGVAEQLTEQVREMQAVAVPLAPEGS